MMRTQHVMQRGPSMALPVRRHSVTRAQRRQRHVCAAQNLGKFKDKTYLDKAAQRFQLGIDNGLEEDELVAMELGAGNPAELTALQRDYFDKVKEKLQQRAEELKAEEKARRMREARSFELGKLAYERGEYPTSVRLFERAVEEIGRNSGLGGEAQMWLALAYQAVGREEDCINLYKYIEANHPIRKVQRQAAELRYIMEAPRLEISAEERVQIPLLETDTWRRSERRSYSTASRAVPKKASGKKTYWDNVQWEMPAFVPDKWYVRVAWAVLAVGVTVYVNWQAADKG